MHNCMQSERKGNEQQIICKNTSRTRRLPAHGEEPRNGAAESAAWGWEGVVQAIDSLALTA